MIRQNILGYDLVFETAEGLFSPKGIDAGTLAMLKCSDIKPDDNVLDLGCGYGVVGVYAAKICRSATLCDISKRALDCAAKNAALNHVNNVSILRSDGYENVDGQFTLILSNPPYHSDFSVAKRFIEQGRKKLVTGGRMLMVTKRRDWYKNKFISVFGGVKIEEHDGYFVFIAEKRDTAPKKEVEPVSKLSKKLKRKADRLKKPRGNGSM